MLRVLWSSRSAMAAQQEKLDNISNNIANANTEGYKRTDVSFRDLVYETLNRKGYPTTADNSINSYNGTGVRAGEWIRDNSQGNLSDTSINTDLAIDGQGYFEVLLPELNEDGTNKRAYTRNGSFNIDSNGNLVDKNGNRLNIAFNADVTAQDKILTKDNFTVDEQGNLYKKNGSNLSKIGKINLYNVTGDNVLKSIGNNLFVADGETPYITQDNSIKQGFLELSNVDISKEMTDMIITQRAFELSSKAMKNADEMWGMANNLRSK